MFAPDHVDVPELVARFRGYLSSSRRPLKLASINALYQLVQRDALSMSKLGGDKLVEELFAITTGRMKEFASDEEVVTFAAAKQLLILIERAVRGSLLKNFRRP